MSLGDPELLELNALCNALIDGAISDADRSRLEQILRDSDDARRFYVRAMNLSASLMQYAGEMQTEAADAPVVARRVVRPAAWIWTFGSLAAAASIVLAFWMGWTKDRGSSPANRLEMAEASPESEEGVARLSGAKDCQWAGSAIQPGDDLHSGQQLKLDSGFAEITFDSGAQVTLEGPAVLDLHSAWEAVLQQGTLKASVPTEAVGFRVSNPSVNVVDLGTEFSMVADAAAGTTEVFVLKGSVETTALDATGHEARPVVLREKQARRFARAGGAEVHDRDSKFEKLMRKVALERFIRPANYVHWSFDEMTGDLVAANVPGFEAKLEGSEADLAVSHSPGHSEQALKLNGQVFAKANFPGIGQRTPHTVAFWVNIPEDASLPDAGAILAWPLEAGRSVTIGWNRDATQGVLGALRTDAGRGSLVGSVALRDGRWHHLAVVFTPRTKAEKTEKSEKEGSWLVRQYVDGRLETTSFKHSIKRTRGEAAPVALAGDALWIGRAVDDSTGERFRGMVDELFVADAALTPQEIRHLMQKNTPAAPEILAAQ